MSTQRSITVPESSLADRVLLALCDGSELATWRVHIEVHALKQPDETYLAALIRVRPTERARLAMTANTLRALETQGLVQHSRATSAWSQAISAWWQVAACPVRVVLADGLVQWTAEVAS